MERSRLVAIIPAFNESKTICSVVKEAVKYCDVFVIDDNSDDNTHSEAIAGGAKVIKNLGPNGYENALNFGYSHVCGLEYENIVTLDADGQHDPAHLGKIIDHIEKSNPSIIIAERTILPRMSEIVFSKITSFLFSIKDPFSGYKCYKKKDYLGHRFGEHKLTGLNFLNLCIVNKKSYLTFPIIVNDRLDEPRFGSTLNANARLVRSIVSFFVLILLRKIK
jgi:glycosyltransferase involved in cell wall biosynthesis